MSLFILHLSFDFIYCYIYLVSTTPVYDVTNILTRVALLLSVSEALPSLQTQ